MVTRQPVLGAEPVADDEGTKGRHGDDGPQGLATVLSPDEADHARASSGSGAALELAAGELRATSQLAQRDAGGVADGAAGPGAQRGQLGDQGSRGVPGEAGPQIIGAGQDQGPGL